MLISPQLKIQLSNLVYHLRSRYIYMILSLCSWACTKSLSARLHSLRIDDCIFGLRDYLFCATSFCSLYLWKRDSSHILSSYWACLLSLQYLHALSFLFYVFGFNRYWKKILIGRMCSGHRLVFGLPEKSTRLQGCIFYL